jgi:NAD(P)-dependent dehydrogenase (short-subunit alcohol dehydrogenase family)
MAGTSTPDTPAHAGCLGDQIAAAHLYLMNNRFVTGTVLTVDGGAVLI